MKNPSFPPLISVKNPLNLSENSNFKSVAAARILLCRGTHLADFVDFFLVAARSITFAVDLRFGRAIYRWKALSIIYNFCEMSVFQIRNLSWSNLGLKLQCLRFQVHFSPCDFSFVPNFPLFSRAFSLLFSSILSLVKPYKSIKHN